MDSKHEKILLNFKKAHSHPGRVIKMTEKGEYCINIMQQNLAVIGLLRSAHQMLMEEYLNTCFKNIISKDDENLKQNMIPEILKVTKLFYK